MLQVLRFNFKKFKILRPQSRKSYIFILYKMLLKCQQTVAYKVSKTKHETLLLSLPPPFLSRNDVRNSLTLYPMLTPFDAFEILCIWKYYGKLSICSFGANAYFP